MIKNKKCHYCHIIKPLPFFHKDKTMIDSHATRCIKCTKLYYKTYYQKKGNKKSFFPYKSTTDPKYIKDKKDLFSLSGNGWWWNPDNRLAKKPKKGVYND